MKKRPRPKKIRKIWTIKPRTRIRTSGRRELLERLRERETRERG